RGPTRSSPTRRSSDLAPAPATDVERALGEAEVLLEVDQQEVDAQPVLGRGPEAVLVAPCDRALEHGLLVRPVVPAPCVVRIVEVDRKSTRLNSSHVKI